MTTKLTKDNISLPIVNLGINWQSVITAAGGSNNATAGEGYLIDTTSNTHTIILPSNPEIGDTIEIKDYAGTFETNRVTVSRNGQPINGVAFDTTLKTNDTFIQFVYIDNTKGWKSFRSFPKPASAAFIQATGGTVTEDGNYKVHTFTGDGCFVVTCAGDGSTIAPSVVDYLVVAGGAGGGFADDFNGGGAGGGAGGFRESKASSSPTHTASPHTGSPLAATLGITVTATTYPITVGGGSSAPCMTVQTQSSAGSNSVFSTITSAGGGAGGVANPTLVGGVGGSGGGGTRTCVCGTFGAGNTPPSSPPQGNPGGLGYGQASVNDGTGGGGGGATATGGNGVLLAVSNPGVGGNGGAGASTSISGSSVAYAGGGGGGSSGGGAASSGGTGGGGNGGGGGASPTNSPGKNGTTNLGGGAGGGAAQAPGANPTCNATYGGLGGAGGSGIVIIRYKFQ
jgi:hypothetical protein